MKICLLLEEKLKPVPETIKTILDAGNIQIVIGDDIDRRNGDHVILEGSADDFVKWLRPFDGIYLGVGVMQEQRFQVFHIKENI